MKDKNLTSLQKIVLFSFVFLMLGVYQVGMNIIVLNTGIDEIPYPRLFLQVLPGLYILHMNFQKRSLKLPHLIVFLLMVSTFILFERFLSSFSDVSSHDYQFCLDQSRIYIFFLMLVNFGLNRSTFNKVIDYALYCVLLIWLITVAGYLGLYKISIYDSTVEYLQAKPQHIIYINFISYQFAFAILLVIIKQLNEKNLSPIYILRNFTIIMLLFGLIIINASRGASVISVILISYYIYFLWKNGIRDIKLKVFVILILLTFPLIYFRSGNISVNFSSSESKIYIVRHFKELETNIEHDVRIVNIRNAWENFKDYPLTGVGYENGSIRYNTGTRCNTQYLQLLGSSGIIFFMIYVFYNFKLIVCRLNLLKRPEIALSLTYFALYLLFEKPLDMTAILGYIAFYFYYQNKNRGISNKPFQQLS